MSNLTKTYESVEHNLHLKYVVNGRIIFYHLDTMTPTGKVTDYSKATLASIIGFCETDNSDKPLQKRFFTANKAGSELFEHADRVDVVHDEDTCFLTINNDGTHNISKLPNKDGSSTVSISLKNEDSFFSPRNRYSIVQYSSKGFYIEFLEEITAENFNERYETPVITLY